MSARGCPLTRGSCQQWLDACIFSPGFGRSKAYKCSNCRQQAEMISFSLSTQRHTFQASCSHGCRRARSDTWGSSGQHRAHLPGEALAVHVDLELLWVEVQDGRVVRAEQGLVRRWQAVARRLGQHAHQLVERLERLACSSTDWLMWKGDQRNQTAGNVTTTRCFCLTTRTHIYPDYLHRAIESTPCVTTALWLRQGLQACLRYMY